MDINNFLEKKEVEIHGKKFIVSMLPCTDAVELRDAVAMNKFIIPMSIKVKLLNYCAMFVDGAWVVIPDREFIDRNIKHPQILDKLVDEVWKHNFDFFPEENNSQH